MKVLSYLKEKSISIIFILYLFFLVLFTKSNFNAAKKGITLWANNVVPSLFPFFVAVELLKHTNLIYFLSIKLDKYMKPIFNLPGVASFPFVMGLISGYPVGAKIVSDLYSNNLCTQKEAERMLKLLSGREHQVITAVTIRNTARLKTFSVTTNVYFKELTDEQINYYIDNFKPYDKAGAYGIQEWIGYVGISRIEGSFYNVMGFPTHRFWEELQSFLKD